jgi:hypothetical protein
MLADASKSTGIVVMGRCYAKVAESMTSSLWVAVASNGIAWPNDSWMHALSLGKDLSNAIKQISVSSLVLISALQFNQTSG